VNEYVLGNKELGELKRLAFQHEVWRAETDLLLERTAIGAGSRVIDLGCGPGFLALDLARRVGAQGKVLALDSSEVFVAHLRRQAEELELDNIEVLQADVLQCSLPAAESDVVVCRWLLMFLPDPESVVRKALRALRTGGMLAVMDYSPFLDISLSPRVESFDRVYRAVARLIEKFGGDPNVGGRVPGMMRAAGFVGIDCQPVSRSDVPGSPLWEWIQQTGTNHGNLVEHGLLSAAELADYHAAMEHAEASGGVLFTAPTVQTIVGRKP